MSSMIMFILIKYMHNNYFW